MARKNRAKKPGLFDAPRYGWKNVQEVERHDSIIVAQQEVKVVSVRQDGGVWWVSAIDPETDTKMEQFYHSHDSLYVQLKQDPEALRGKRGEQ
jgi:hypothetical protein